ncbi:MAG TPA: YqeG family HAD IIIA-type phosphatase [Bacilli bacterium]|nr:YqeG family HAD IIIA-type phosphatase [Bacilli bacterium]
MLKTFRPTYHALSVYDIDIDFYKKHGFENVIVDLDNTLDSYKLFEPSVRAKELIERLLAAGLSVFIISNNHSGRVNQYADALHLPYLANAHKPFKKRILQYIRAMKIDVSKTILIGDQLLTDVVVANKIGLPVVLTEKLVREDQWTTRFNRLFDRPIRKYLRQKNLLPDWRN